MVSLDDVVGAVIIAWLLDSWWTWCNDDDVVMGKCNKQWSHSSDL